MGSGSPGSALAAHEGSASSGTSGEVAGSSAAIHVGSGSLAGSADAATSSGDHAGSGSSLGAYAETVSGCGSSKGTSPAEVVSGAAGSSTGCSARAVVSCGAEKRGSSGGSQSSSLVISVASIEDAPSTSSNQESVAVSGWLISTGAGSATLASGATSSASSDTDSSNQSSGAASGSENAADGVVIQPTSSAVGLSKPRSANLAFGDSAGSSEGSVSAVE